MKTTDARKGPHTASTQPPSLLCDDAWGIRHSRTGAVWMGWGPLAGVRPPITILCI